MLSPLANALLFAAANSTNNVSGAVSGTGSGLDLVVVGIGFLLVVVALVLLFFLQKFIVNSIIGLVALVLVNWAGIPVSLSLPNILITGVLGLLGVGILVLLSVLGFSV